MKNEPADSESSFRTAMRSVDYGNGLVYRTPDALYTVELDPPGHPLSDEPFGVDLVRTTRSEHGLEREQRLTLAEYHSYMAAEEHVREVEKTLLEQGRDGLQTDMALVDAMPFEPDTAIYLVGLYPPDPEAERGTLQPDPPGWGAVGYRAGGAWSHCGTGIPSSSACWMSRPKGIPAGCSKRLPWKPCVPMNWLPTPRCLPGKEKITERQRRICGRENHPDWPDASAWEQLPVLIGAAGDI